MGQSNPYETALPLPNGNYFHRFVDVFAYYVHFVYISTIKYNGSSRIPTPHGDVSNSNIFQCHEIMCAVIGI